MSLRAATLARAPAATARSNLRPARRAPRAAPRARAGKGDGETDEAEATQQNGMTGAGLRQLIKMGLGTISGDITEINLDDPARTVVMELESNNFAVDDETGQLKQGKYRDEGFVDEEETSVNWVAIGVVLLLTAGAGAFVVKTLGALSEM